MIDLLRSDLKQGYVRSFLEQPLARDTPNALQLVEKFDKVAALIVGLPDLKYSDSKLEHIAKTIT